MDVLLVTRAALEHHDLDEMRREVLNHLERIFKCDKSTFFLAGNDFQELHFEGVVSAGFEKHYMDQFIAYYHKLDPYVPGLRFRPPIIVTEQLISFSDLVKTEYYNDFLKPQQIYYQLAMVLKSGKRLLGALAFLRPRQASNFSVRDMDKAELTALYLSEILNKNILLDQMMKQTLAFESLATGMPFKGEMLLDESLAPIRMDEQMKKLFSLFSNEPYTRTAVSIHIPERVRVRCEKLLRSGAVAEGVQVSDDFTLELGGASLPLKIVMRLTEQEKGAPVFLVGLERQTPVATLKERWVKLGLTQREVEVALFACQGFQNSEISERLFISRYTVENHLKSIYNKVGVGNRTMLTHKLLNS